jgi:hypothetical protein
MPIRASHESLQVIAISVLRLGAPIVVVINLVKGPELSGQGHIPTLPPEWTIFKRVPEVFAL